jgi:NADPH:quinone reductase-like Zn-dependent oxidoreductase
MKAIEYKKYGSPEVLEINEIVKPLPKSDEVLIKIEATTVSAVDSIFRSGKQFFARLATGLTKPKQFILGTDFAGTIEAAGSECKEYKVGDRVFGSTAKGGTHAEYISISEKEVIQLIPENMKSEEIVSIPYGSLTSLPFLRDSGEIKEGMKILIIGASGSVGVYAIQFAKYFKAEVTGVCSSSSIELVKSLGADKTIDYTKEDFTETGEQFDLIFDTVGKSSFSKCKNSLKENGKYLTAFLNFTILKDMLLTSIIGRKKAIVSFTGLRKPEERLKDLKFIKTLVEKGDIKPVVDKIYKMNEIRQAHEYVDTGHKKGDVVLTFGGNT